MGQRDQGAGGRSRTAHSTAAVLGRTGTYALPRLAERDPLIVGVVQRGHRGDGAGVPGAAPGLRLGGSEVVLSVVFPAVMVVVVVPMWRLG